MKTTCHIQNAPNVPDPQGYNSLLQVLGTKGLFDNITGLDANQRNALEAMLSSQAAAQNYAAMASQLAQAAGNYDLAKQSQLLKNKDQILGMIQDSGLNDAQKQEYTKKLLEGIVGGEGGNGSLNEVVQNALSKDNLSKLKYAGKDGNAEVEIGGNNNPQISPDMVKAIAQLAGVSPEQAQDIIDMLQNGSSVDELQDFIAGLTQEAEASV